MWAPLPFQRRSAQSRFLLFHIGSGTDARPVTNCTNASSAEHPEDKVPEASVGAAAHAAPPGVRRSASLGGPWVPANTTMPGPCVNPAPWALLNGSLAVVCSGSSLVALALSEVLADPHRKPHERLTSRAVVGRQLCVGCD